MFKKFSNIASMLKQAHEVRGKMDEMQQRLARVRVEGTAGAGMVTVQASGQQKVLGVRIEDSLLGSDDKEMLEDLLVAAVNTALEKSKEAAAEEVSKFTGELNLPGLNEMLAKFNGGAAPGPDLFDPDEDLFEGDLGDEPPEKKT